MTVDTVIPEVDAAITLCQHLCAANTRMGPFLDSLIPRPGQSASGTPERMSALLSELLQVGAALRVRPLPARDFDVELDRELDRYRRHVERLRELMPALRLYLLAERSHLEGQRNRIHAVAEWAQTSRQTL